LHRDAGSPQICWVNAPVKVIGATQASMMPLRSISGTRLVEPSTTSPRICLSIPWSAIWRSNWSTIEA